MTPPVSDAYTTLTEKELQTLRLIVRGHDAKSIARHLDLSIHTVNERLRGARRKLGLSSSREAARLVLEREGGVPQILVPDVLGEAAAGPTTHAGPPPAAPARRRRRVGLIAGGTIMASILGYLLLAALSPQAPAPSTFAGVTAEAVDPAVEATALRFLALVDQGKWDASYAMFGTAFRKQNSASTWASVSDKVRVPLGAVTSRRVVSQQNLPAPPNGYEVLKFATSFANKPDTMETVTLEREGGAWRVVAILIG